MKVSLGDLKVGPEERRLVNQVLRSNRLSYGPVSRRFEKRFAAIHKTKHAVFCNSGTSALQIALQALRERDGYRDGDEVIVPAVTFVATSNIVLHNRMKPVFVDVDPNSFNLDPKRIREAVTRRTRCIIPVHLMGLPCDMKEILDVGLPVIEDCCEAFGARYRGRPVGSFGDVGCFSTYMAHYVVTGVGGLALTGDAWLERVMRSLMNHGRDAAYLSIDDDDIRGNRLNNVVAKRFRFLRPGHSFRCTELEAAIGLPQLATYREMIRRRRAAAAYLMEGLADLEGDLQLPTEYGDREHVFMLFPLVTRNEPKNRLVAHLEAGGVETRDLMPLIDQPVNRGLVRGRFPVARRLLSRGFYIGCHQYLTRKHLDYVIRRIRGYFRGKRRRTSPGGNPK